MALYELGLVLSPELEGEEREAFLSELRTLVTTGGASIVREDVWGKRNLAYEIRHKREGFYVFWQFDGSGAVIKPLEYKLKLSDQVLRYLTLNLDREMRRSRKMERRRAERKAKAAATRAQAAAASSGVAGEA
jgi:small subunit ribosomal protein S6